MPRNSLTPQDENNKKIISARLSQLVTGNNITQSELATATGINSSTLNGYVNGTSLPTAGNVQKLADYFKVTKSFIDPRFESAPVNPINVRIDSYNFFDAGIAAGQLETVDPFFADTVEQIELPSAIMGRYAGSEDIFVSRVNGESMNKVLPDQSLIAVKKFDDIEELKDRDIVVFKDDEDYSVKRFFNRKDAGVYLFKPESNNEAFQDIIIRYESANELEIVGKVVVYVVEL